MRNSLAGPRWFGLKLYEVNLWFRGTGGSVDARAILYKRTASDLLYARNIDEISNDTDHQT